jgi:glycerophosphoryl diester phosphodiesterase
VDRAVKDMSFDEVRQLCIDSPTNPEEGVPVLTFEELLDASKGRIKLFIELKGSTADRQMVDDVVRMVRERDAVDDVALISLSYDAISYAEQTYPEFETGLLYFAGYGDLSLIQCDMLLVEEEAAMATSTQTVHDLGKQLGVWTVNTRDAMHTFLTKDIDLVITDQLVMAGEVQDELDARSDLEVIYDVIFG